MKYKKFPGRLCTEQKIEDNLLHFIAKHAKDSCLQITSNRLKLKIRHHYYAQIQGGMGGLIWQSIVTTEIWRIYRLKEFTLTQFIGMILNVSY